jgi:hypothetical protein
MNTGQMMITILAMFLLSMIILTTNRGFLMTNTTMIDSRYDILSVSLATSILEDATSVAFDEKTAGAAVTATSSLTAVSSLGIDGAESSTRPDLFDDCDDYNCYKTNPKLDTLVLQGTTQKIILNSYCRVDYVDGNSPNTVSTTQTYHKKISVRVISPGMTDTVKLSTIYSYWYFR